MTDDCLRHSDPYEMSDYLKCFTVNQSLRSSAMTAFHKYVISHLMSPLLLSLLALLEMSLALARNQKSLLPGSHGHDSISFHSSQMKFLILASLRIVGTNESGFRVSETGIELMQMI